MADHRDFDLSLTPARHLTLAAADGFELGARLYEPEGVARANLVIHAATGAPQGYYRRFASYLRAAGFRVLTYDYRGIGESLDGSPRALRARLSDWARLDARAAHCYLRDHHGGLPLALVGHSFGGQLIGLLDETHEVDAAVLVGAQLAYLGHWPLLPSLGLSALWRGVVPAATALFGYLPSELGLGEDLPRGVAQQWAAWCTHPHYMMGEHPEARERFSRFDRPTLFYSFSDDVYAPRRAVESLLSYLPARSVTHLRLEPRDLHAVYIGHFGFFRKRFEPTLWSEARGYLEHHLGLATA